MVLELMLKVGDKKEKGLETSCASCGARTLNLAGFMILSRDY